MFSVRNLRPIALLLCLLAIGCLDRGGDDEQRNLSPTAVPTVIGAGANDPDGMAQVRAGSIVLLTAKDSGGGDAPVLRFSWRPSGSSDGSHTQVVLEERSANTVAFRAPAVSEDTRFDFTLTVIDAQGDSDSETISLKVVAVGDIDKFLSRVDGPTLGILSRRDFQTDFAKFTVRVQPDIPAQVSMGDTFDLTTRVIVHYPNRSAACLESFATALGVIQCLRWERNAVVLLDGVTLAGIGRLPLVRVNVPWEFSGGTATTTDVVLPVPPLVLGQINQQILDVLRDRDEFFDEWKVDSAEVIVELSVATPARTTLFYGGPGSPGSTPVPRGVVRSGRASPASVSTADILADADGALQIETPETAAAYYEAIAGDDHRTLNDWLISRGFMNPGGTLRQAAVDGTGEFAHAKYTNNFDLGFGRDMYTRVDPANGNVYSFVTNYSALQGALELRGAFATVVMEYSPAGGGAGADKFTKFFTYMPDEDSGEQLRVSGFDFDGRGQKFAPGVCVACHSGVLPRKDDALDPGGYPGGGDVDAAFLPWDLESFLYSNTDPAIPGARITDDTLSIDDLDPQRRFTRAAQESQFRKLNSHALATYNHDTVNSKYDAVRELLALWYSDPGSPLPDLSLCAFDTCLSGPFRNRRIPAAWDDGGVNAEAYTEVFAQSCRACHTMLDDRGFAFATPDELLTTRREIATDLVFRTGAMPIARFTLDRLWTGRPGDATRIDALRDALGAPADLRPGAPVVGIQVVNDGATGAGINLSYVVVPPTERTDSRVDGDEHLTQLGRTVELSADVTTLSSSEAAILTWEQITGVPGCAGAAGTLVPNGAFASFTPQIASDTPYCLEAVATQGTLSGRSNRVLVEAVAPRDPVVDADCPVATGTCAIEVNEGGDSATLLGALALGQATGMFFLQLADADVDERLDPAEALGVQFVSPSSGNGSVRLDGGVPFGEVSFDRFFDMDVTYQTSGVEIGANDVIVELDYRLFDDGVQVGGVRDGSIRVKPVNGNAPQFGTLPSPELQWSNATNFNVSISDQDAGPLTVTRSPANGSFGSLTLNTAQPMPGGSPNYQASFTYSAGTATASVPSCNANGGPNSFEDMFTLRADDDVNDDSETLIVTVTPNFTYEGTIRSRLSNTSFTGTGTCERCHANGVGPQFLAADMNVPKAGYPLLIDYVNFSDPVNSSLIAEPEQRNGRLHGGGLVSGTAWNTMRTDLITWINECAPKTAP